jgi:AcrR family transcriptional regulator
MTNTMDRRILRTRTRLHRALMALISRAPYDAITVADICEEAGVGRSTFYLHFAGKDDLKRSGLKEFNRQLAAVQHAGLTHGKGDGFGFTRALFEHAREHLDHYRALAGSKGGGIALDTIRANAITLIGDALPGPPTATRDLAVQYVAGALMAVLTWWLDTGAVMEPAEVDALFQRLLREGLGTLPMEPG